MCWSSSLWVVTGDIPLVGGQGGMAWTGQGGMARTGQGGVERTVTPPPDQPYHRCPRRWGTGCEPWAGWMEGVGELGVSPPCSVPAAPPQKARRTRRLSLLRRRCCLLPRGKGAWQEEEEVSAWGAGLQVELQPYLHEKTLTISLIIDTKHSSCVLIILFLCNNWCRGGLLVKHKPDLLIPLAVLIPLGSEFGWCKLSTLD